MKSEHGPVRHLWRDMQREAATPSLWPPFMSFRLGAGLASRHTIEGYYNPTADDGKRIIVAVRPVVEPDALPQSPAALLTMGAARALFGVAPETYHQREGGSTWRP